MQIGYVLLGLVTLTSVHISSGQECRNGLVGFENGNICCAESCGTCGGSGCGGLDGGPDNCCTGAITAAGMVCSETGAAPCIIDDAAPECRNGFVGFETGDICCAESCGTCGGAGCGGLDGGPPNCCAGAITSAGMLCSETGEAPCIIDDVAMCTNGLPGIQNEDACCDTDCGVCGGTGCGGLPGGAENCCIGTITTMDMLCSATGSAPCIVDDAVLCSNGVFGIENDGVCCEARCGTCGGFGCSLQPGGSESCCIGMVEESGIFCDDTPVAPCIV